jgi:SH3 domain
MVEYVYARRDFVAEDEGEIALRAGERIEVIEKDEVYDDGWWQVRSLSWCFCLLSCRGTAICPSFYLSR